MKQFVWGALTMAAGVGVAFIWPPNGQFWVGYACGFMTLIVAAVVVSWLNGRKAKTA